MDKKYKQEGEKSVSAIRYFWIEMAAGSQPLNFKAKINSIHGHF
jgi:hypothetical protein